ncbi:hypothetical protein B0H19DRAFT_1060075 [Mycena capillaripes]|nr:hypothetical protein B0H19DRAFT_1060075 [Mycena capillaripes]
MSTERVPQLSVEPHSTTKTEFYSAPSGSGQGPAGVGSPISDVALPTKPLGSPTPPHGGESPTQAQLPEYFRIRRRNRAPYLRDAFGIQYKIVSDRDHSRPLSRGSPSEIPTSHSALLGTPGDGPSTESSITTDSLPCLMFDLDLDQLGRVQIAQLNVIRRHIGMANSQIIAASLLAEHQASTEDIQDSILAIRAEVLSRVDSLRNEINSQRLRLNRVLDDNLRIVSETGVSGAQINDLIQTMTCNGGAHRKEWVAAAGMEVPALSMQLHIPGELHTVIDAAVPPRGSGKSQEEFEKHHERVPTPKVGSASRVHLRHNANRANTTLWGCLGANLSQSLGSA